MTWVVPERERLNHFFINACMQYAEICLGESDIESTLDLCQRVFANDPYLEKAHRLAMLAYAASGNQAAIVRQFHQLKHELKTGLNAKPSETVDLQYAHTIV
jgi:DNA-binding SARP family transcriptional activator